MSSRAVEYRQKMPVTEFRVFHFSSGDIGFFVCPRCKISLERDFANFCSYCGQRLGWKRYRKVKNICPNSC